MPRQLFSADELVKMASEADSVILVKRGGRVKIKLPTPNGLYTYVCREEDAEELLNKMKDLKKEIIEF